MESYRERLQNDKIRLLVETKMSFLQPIVSIVEVHKGFSKDQKYVINEDYLLRLFPSDEAIQRKKEADVVAMLATYSDVVPKVIHFGWWNKYNLAYMLLQYIPGSDGEGALPLLSSQQQYEAGYSAGEELYQLHQCPAPEGTTDWYTVKKAKNDRYFKQLALLDIDSNLKQSLQQYIEKHEHLMQDRPNVFQHDDFHPSNLIINKGKLAGIIDFGRMDWGDPVHDLQKLSFFSVPISIPFSKGIIDGYHHGEAIPTSFWQLLSLYEAIHIVSALVWGKKDSEEQYKLLWSYSMNVLAFYNHFQNQIPSWYNHSKSFELPSYSVRRHNNDL